MGTVNIRRDVSDPFYRYKMEKLQSKIEGKGNGIKTVITNLSSVAHSLARPPSYVIKYFGFELGAQTNIDPSDDRWIVNGAHEASKLQDYLDGFISKFVLCKKCKNPETDVHIKDGNITLDCKACGQRSDVDLRLKLSGFIIKHAPKKGKKDKSTKKADRKAKKEAQAKNGENGENGAGSDDGSPDNGSNNSDNGEENGEVELDAGSDDELTRRINAEAKDLADNEEEVKWTIDVSEEATKARAKQLPDDLKKQLALDDDEEGGEGDDNPYSQLGAWVESQAKEKGDIAKLDDVEIYKKAAELGIEKKHRTLTVLAQTLFDENIVKQITPRAAMLKKMITSDRHEKALLGGTERLIGMTHPDLIPALPKILMQYYENDLASEETLTAWGSKASKKYVDISISRKVRKAAVPFITWLETAESDDDDSE
ncbi:hypothetical protein FH972_023712 [Carpinus fangiana]|uniref:W2 domain-containing protein n=1 Tax=Carpinus fangiana TaxID=176857 RepID=A0A5N6KW87_9ROSI|nr:hypothetical protein FH972_023712 [Carpinus fangiana]